MNLYFLMVDGPMKHRLVKVDSFETQQFVVEQLRPAAYWNKEPKPMTSIKTAIYTPNNALRTYLQDGSIVVPARSEKTTDILGELFKHFARNDILKD